jgi:creatinine amidohydrolase
MKLAELTWPEAASLDRDTVIVDPIAALEQHSHHLPFFTDTILCEAVAARVEALTSQSTLFLPVQWLGASSHHLGMAGSLTAENETYLRMIAEPLRCLLRHGFKRIFILNGHGGNVDAFHLSLRQLALEFPDALLAGASYWDVCETETAAILEGKRKTVGHACEFETSLMLHIRPELVRRDKISDSDMLPGAPSWPGVYVPLDMKRQTDHGGTGEPSLATAKKGEKLLEAIVKNLVSIINDFRVKKL